LYDQKFGSYCKPHLIIGFRNIYKIYIKLWVLFLPSFKLLSQQLDSLLNLEACNKEKSVTVTCGAELEASSEEEENENEEGAEELESKSGPCTACLKGLVLEGSSAVASNSNNPSSGSCSSI
jgi:hypothetical protein